MFFILGPFCSCYRVFEQLFAPRERVCVTPPPMHEQRHSSQLSPLPGSYIVTEVMRPLVGMK